jgi:hypothetical protein
MHTEQHGDHSGSSTEMPLGIRNVVGKRSWETRLLIFNRIRKQARRSTVAPPPTREDDWYISVDNDYNELVAEENDDWEHEILYPNKAVTTSAQPTARTLETIVQPLSDNDHLRRAEMIRRLQATELRSNVFWHLYRAWNRAISQLDAVLKVL